MGEQETKLFRFIVLLILILIFITVATIKIWELRIAAERVGITHTINSLKSAVGVKLSEIVIREGINSLAKLDKSNPMRLWNPPPINYTGEFNNINAPIEQGIWYYNTDAQMLIYRVRFTDNFITSNPNLPDLVRYQLRLEYLDYNNNGQFDSNLDTAIQLDLQPVDTYQWLTEEK